MLAGVFSYVAAAMVLVALIVLLTEASTQPLNCKKNARTESRGPPPEAAECRDFAAECRDFGRRASDFFGFCAPRRRG
jgi:hypothetical protein